MQGVLESRSMLSENATSMIRSTPWGVRPAGVGRIGLIQGDGVRDGEGAHLSRLAPPVSLAPLTLKNPFGDPNIATPPVMMVRERSTTACARCPARRA